MSLKLIVASVFFFAVPFFVSAQQTAVPLPDKLADNETIALATVHIYNAAFTQNENTFSLSFDLTNERGIQPGVKYSVVLVQKTATGQVIVDEHVYDETINLVENSSVHKVISYEAPVTIAGEYTLFVSSKNANGFSFGQAALGKINLTKKESKDGIAIDVASCFLTVEGENTQFHYTPLQGVDISSTENLQSNCVVENTSNDSVTIVPSFVTRLRSNFGDRVDAVGGDTTPLTFAPTEKKTIVTTLPKSSTPQSYNVNLSYGTMSNEVSYHYVVQGGSGTIQNILLDKDTYKEGEKAMFSFVWTNSADNFIGSRNGTNTQLTAPSFTVSLTDERGNICANPLTKVLVGGNILVQAEINITSPCVHSKANVILVDAKLGILSQSSFGTVMAGASTELSREGELKYRNEVIAILIGAISFVMIFILILILFRRKTKSVPPIIPLIIIFATGIMFAHVESAKALILQIPLEPTDVGSEISGTPVTVDVSINKPTYAPKEAMRITGSITSLTSANTTLAFTAKYSIDSGAEKYLVGVTPSGGNTFVDFADDIAPMNAGNHVIIISVTSSAKSSSKFATIPFTVVNPVAEPGVCDNTGGYNCKHGTMSSPSGDATIGWTWYCDGTPNTAANRSPLCSYKPEVAVTGVCGTPFTTINGNPLGTCDAGTIGSTQPVLQSDGTSSWHCFGSGGGADSPLCIYIPSYSCTGTVPTNATTWNDTVPKANTDYAYSASDGVCKYQCNSGYNWVAESNSCVIIPTVTLSEFNPTSITAGQSSSLLFNSTDATTCSGKGLWNGKLEGTNTGGVYKTTGVINSAGTYTQSITCTGPGGSVTAGPKTLTVTSTLPVASWTPHSATIAYNGHMQVGYSSTNATHCSIFDSGNNALIVSKYPASNDFGSMGPFTSSWGRKLICYNSVGTASEPDFLNVVVCANRQVIIDDVCVTPAHFCTYLPSNATTWNDTIPTSNTPYAYASSAGTCKYYCDADYHWDGSNSCATTVPVASVSAVSPIAHNTSSTLTLKSTDATSCTLGFYDSAGMWQVSPVTINTTVIKPTEVLTSNRTYYFGCSNGAASSRWSSVVVVVNPAPSCRGIVPANALMYPNDNAGLTTDVSYVYAFPNTSTKCEYACNAGFTWDGTGKCVKKSCVQSCSGDWSSCTKSCGKGTQTRSCVDVNCNPYTSAPRDCNTTSCSGS